VDAHGRPTLDGDRLFDVLDGVGVLLYVVDLEGRFVYVNQAAATNIGKPQEEIAGRTMAELFDPVSVARWTKENAEVLRTLRPLDLEDRWQGRVYHSHKTPVWDADGGAVGVIGISTDITDQVAAKDESRRREALLIEAQQIAGVGSWHWDPERQEVEWSPELRRIFGLEPGTEPLGPETLELVHPDDRAPLTTAARTALRDGGTFELELRIRRGDGEERLISSRGGATLGPDGTARRLDGVCEDITERRRAEAHLAEAQRLAGIGSFDRDLDADEVTWSPETYRIFGVDPEHLVPSRENVLSRVIDEDRERLRGEVDRAIRDDGAFDCFVSIRRDDGEQRDLRVRGAVHMVGGGPRHLIGIVQDLTDVRAAERERVELGERFRSVFERAPVGLALVAPGGRFAHVNEALAEFVGRDRETLVGMSVEEVTHPDDMAENTEALRRMAAGELQEWNTEARYLRPDGEVRWGAVRSLLLHDAEGRSSQCLTLVRDITEQRLAERRRAATQGVLDALVAEEGDDTLSALVRAVVEELGWERGRLWLVDEGGAPPAGDHVVALEAGALVLDGDGQPLGEELTAAVSAFIVRRRAEAERLHEALHDPLTGLPNRVLFFDRLEHALRRQQREHAPLAVLFLDFDGFKAVNDRFGHAGGDRVLREAASLVASTLRAEDTVSRFGGDELVVLSEHILGRHDAAGIAQRILDRLRTPIHVDGEEVVLSASIGICVAPVEGRTGEQLLDVADAAMYRAKAAGPGRYVVAE
jgi:diguanylate cyclase (GGDEF)-like protein/PAS domain S-box-containing protein